MAFLRRLTGCQLPSDDAVEEVQSSSSNYPREEPNSFVPETCSEQLSSMLQSIGRRFSRSPSSKDTQGSKGKGQSRRSNDLGISSGVNFSPVPSNDSLRSASQIKKRICSIIKEASQPSSCSYRTARSGGGVEGGGGGGACDDIRDKLRNILQLAGGSSSSQYEDPCGCDASMADNNLDSNALIDIRDRLAVILQLAEDSKCGEKKCEQNCDSECEHYSPSTGTCACGVVSLFWSYLICRCKNCIPCVINIALVIVATIIAICTLALLSNSLYVYLIGKGCSNKCGHCLQKTSVTSLTRNAAPPDVYPTCMLYQGGPPCACKLNPPVDPKCTWWKSVFINNCELDKNDALWI